MKILSVDTSAVCASVAVTEDDKIISLCNTNAGLTHSRTLLPMTLHSKTAKPNFPRLIILPAV